MNNKNDSFETYAVEKRNRGTDTERDIRISRSGKRVKAHDTITQEQKELRRLAHMKRSNKKVDPVVRVPNQTATEENPRNNAKEETARGPTETRTIPHDVTILPGNRIKPQDVLEGKHYVCSLEQLMPLPGFQTELFKLTKKQKKVNKETGITIEKPVEVFQVQSNSQVRRVNTVAMQDLGAPRVEAVINGEILVDAIMDSGSHCSIMSKRLAHELGLKLQQVGPRTSSPMADGKVVYSQGEAENVIIQVQRVWLKVNLVIFEVPPYDLLGSDCIKMLGISTDYATSHFSIMTDQGMEPLSVPFDTDYLRMQRLKASNSDSTNYSVNTESSSDE
ncbi:hypothetical protein A0J61_11620, partial [Choanephora cucurbitarum]